MSEVKELISRLEELASERRFYARTESERIALDKTAHSSIDSVIKKRRVFLDFKKYYDSIKGV